MIISSQDFRNAYEGFYAQMRKYLWPYNVLEELANVEVDIYSAFIDMDKLDKDFKRLEASIREVLKEDADFRKRSGVISDMIQSKDEDEPYLRLTKVEEVHPENDKQIRTIPEPEEEEII